MPALAADAFSTSRLFFGAGINPASLYSASQDATLFVVDPTRRHAELEPDAREADSASTLPPPPEPLVGQQSFADGVFFQTKAPGYLPDNVANLDLQADSTARSGSPGKLRVTGLHDVANRKSA